jgi:capsid protein
MTTFTGLPGQINLVEAWGDFVDPLEFLREDPSFGLTSVYGMNMRGDRKDGEARPVINTETDLDIIRSTARVLDMISPAAINAIGNLKNYVVGPGFKYPVLPEKGVTPPDGLVEAVEKLVAEFLDDNDFTNDLDRELYHRSVRDGERFTALYNVGGQCQLRIVEPELVREPHNKSALDSFIGSEGPMSWTFGVQTRKADMQKPLGYYVQWDESEADNWEYFDTATLLHSKRNVDRGVKRGLSDFYPVKAWLERVEKLLANTAEGASIQAAIAFIREHVQGVTPSQVSSFVADKTYRQYQEGTPYAERTRNQTRYKPGTVVNVPAGQKYLYGPMGQSNAPVFLEIEQAILRFIGMRWQMPEYMGSGDASNANYASTLVAESPFVKFATSEQKREGKYHLALIWKALEMACAAGRLSQFGIADCAQLELLVDIQAEPPMIATRDTDKETNRHKIMVDSGIMAPQTWAAKEGLDYDDERAKGADKAAPVSPEGLLDSPLGIGDSGAGDDADGGDEPLDQADSMESLLENCGTGDGGFQPGNDCGGKGGGGSGSKPTAKAGKGGAGLPKSTKKITISQAASFMAEHGDKLHGGLAFDAKTKQARYDVTVDGKRQVMTADQVKQYIEAKRKGIKLHESQQTDHIPAPVRAAIEAIWKDYA